MGLFGSKSTKQIEKWDVLFPNVSEQDVRQTKIMVYYCLYFTDEIEKMTNILSSMTNGQYIQSIAFLKIYVFHLVDIAPIHHNLFYGLLCEYYIKHNKLELNEAIEEMNQIKNAERLYFNDYILRDEEDRSRNLNIKYYKALKKLENNNEETHIKVSEEVFRQEIGKHLINFREILLEEYSKQGYVRF